MDDGGRNMTDRELIQQALDALKWNLSVIEDYGDKGWVRRGSM